MNLYIYIKIIFQGNIEQSSSSPKIQKQENNDHVNDNSEEEAKEQTKTTEEPKEIEEN